MHSCSYVISIQGLVGDESRIVIICCDSTVQQLVVGSSPSDCPRGQKRELPLEREREGQVYEHQIAMVPLLRPQLPMLYIF